MRRLLLAVAAILLVSLAVTPGHAQYRIVEIAGPGDVRPAAINSSGMVVGTMTQLTNPVYRPWTWTGDALEFLAIPGTGGFATSVNDSGVVVGSAFVPPTFDARPYRWIGGVATEIPMPGPAYVRGHALAINDSGVVLLEMATKTTAGIYALWDGSTPHDPRRPRRFPGR